MPQKAESYLIGPQCQPVFGENGTGQSPDLTEPII